MAKSKISLCVTFALCLFLLVGFGWSDQSQNSDSGSLQNSIQALELQMSLILKRLETVEKGKEELEKQVKSLNEKLDGFESKISEDNGLWLLTPPARGPPGKDGKQGDSFLPDPKSIKSCGDAMEKYPFVPKTKQSIYPHQNPQNSTKKVQVLCDFETDGGGWTIIQKRTSGPKHEFNRNWANYTRGFGSVDGNFWLGLDNIRALTQNGDQELRIQLEDFEGEKKWAKYSNFSISDASDFYRLNISGFFANSTAGDSMTSYSDAGNGAGFSTKDKDHSTSGGNCAEKFSTGGWWHNGCYYAAPNGLYFGKGESRLGGGIFWTYWKGGLAKTEIKIRTRK